MHMNQMNWECQPEASSIQKLPSSCTGVADLVASPPKKHKPPPGTYAERGLGLRRLGTYFRSSILLTICSLFIVKRYMYIPDGRAAASKFAE